MSTRYTATPDGLRDVLFEENAARRSDIERMGALFASHGYREVSTPEWEYYDLFVKTGSPLPEESMIKLIDRSGRICVLRPDSTTPIARLATTRLASQPLPLALWYAQPVFRSLDSLAGHHSRVMQAGVELIGSAGTETDADILRLAADAIALRGTKGHIEISHAGLFTLLCEALELGEDKRERIRAHIERKSFAALGDELEGLIGHPAAQDLMLLMRLSGGTDILEEARACRCEALRAPLVELAALGALLPKEGFSYDFGMVQSIEYYTGIVFRGYVSGAAAAVLQGGRYDRLLSLLGRDAPAVGFVVNMDRE